MRRRAMVRVGFVVAAGSSIAQLGAVPIPGAAGIGQPPAGGRGGAMEVVRGGPAMGQRDPSLEVVALFDGPAMPTGITISREGRLFVSFPRWEDPVEATAVELRGGRMIPFPDAQTNQFYPEEPGRVDPAEHLVSVQSVVVDGLDRLWLLDSGSVNLGPNLRGAAKLWGYDLATGRRIKRIGFPTDVVLKRTYLNDVRFDLARGPEGTAYITDSGAGGIIVVDLASGASWRRLDTDPSVKATPGLRPTSEGAPAVLRLPSGERRALDVRSDGIALSPDGRTLYYTPLVGRDVWAVPAALLADPDADEREIAAAVRLVATKPSSNDGLICDAQGRVYSADWEDNAIRRIDPRTGTIEVLTQDERMLWPDTFTMLGSDLYVTSNQLSRQPKFHFGTDQRRPPYALFRLRVDGTAKEGPRR